MISKELSMAEIQLDILTTTLMRLQSELEELGNAKKMLDNEREKTAANAEDNDITLGKCLDALDARAKEFKKTSETNSSLANILEPLAETLSSLAKTVNRDGFTERLEQMQSHILEVNSAIQILQSYIDKSDKNQLNAIKQSAESINSALQKTESGVSSGFQQLQTRIKLAENNHATSITESAKSSIQKMESIFSSGTQQIQARIDLTEKEHNKAITESAKYVNNLIEKSTAVISAAIEKNSDAVIALRQRIDLLEMNQLNSIKAATSETNAIVAKSNSSILSQIQSSANSQREIMAKLSTWIYASLGASVIGFILMAFILLKK